MKLAVIGGGSTYTPELVAGLARERERLDLRHLVLQDPDPERREVVGGLAGRMLDAADYRGELLVTDDLDRALDGASFVLVQLRVGGQAARRRYRPQRRCAIDVQHDRRRDLACRFEAAASRRPLAKDPLLHHTFRRYRCG